MILRVLSFIALALGLGCATAPSAQAQAEPIKFGKLDLKEFDAKNFAADTAAEAVVMADFGRSHFEYVQNQFKVVFERVTRIKILKKAGYDMATVSVPLYRKNGNEERLSNLRGFTYNLVNGQLVKEKLESSGIFTEQRDANNSVRKFTLPNVKEGSIIEYAYNVSSDFWFNFQDWQFQYSVPVRWSEYRASIPEYFDYRMAMQGYEPLAASEQNEGNTQFTVRQEGGAMENITARTKTYRWVMKDVPGFRQEPFITTTRDYVSRIDFELRGTQFPQQPYEEATGNWNKINSELLAAENFGTQLNRTGFLKAEVAAIMAKHTEPLARAAAVQQLVQTNVQYNDLDRMYSAGVRKAYEQHTGNSADINLLLIGLLRNVGLTANPAILSTRDHGRLDESSPMMSRFNYVLAAVTLPGQAEALLLDATQKHADFGMLPERVLNTRAHLVTEKSLEDHWLTVASRQRYVHFQTAQLQLDDRGGWKGKIHDEHAGYNALSARASLQKLGEKKYIETNYLKQKDGWAVPKYTVQQADLLAKPLAVDMEVEAPGDEDPNGTLYFSPMRNFGEDENPFKLVNRQFPVDFGAGREETLMLTF
ncbi:DUF3857 domain-containing protein [Hymenobacter lutimineralis]|uniref:DUF3857 domain-containing protein n=1 Tax=Hymenobacter lutimineralis TaxID=2606448 RepID=A0A5D6V9S1_9BACT|nr:DUF3857 domain-containing protein [Hymenobacter lutimineralis]TYZ11987.1 DUF3857 domain-containing protein [Hymenobacter lutimineralis]